MDGDPPWIRPAAAWFSSSEVASAMGPVLRRPYDPDRPGLTEAAVERGHPLVLGDLERWPGAEGLRDRLRERLDDRAADVAWDWYRRSRLLACPVRTSAGRILGVLAVALRGDREVDERELRAIDALAGLAAVAVERAELLDREAARAREEALLRDAAREIAASLEPDDVHAAIAARARALADAAHATLWIPGPADDALRAVARAGAGAPEAPASAEGSPAQALRTRATVSEGSALHVPLALGPRAFGVVTVHPAAGERLEGEAALRLEALAPLAAGAMANAQDFARERRVARALARSFVPSAAPELPGVDVGLVYAPAELTGGGGDFFGVWPLAADAVAMLVGDVSGKGLEMSGLSAMIRFFVEARTWDTADPARALTEVNALVAARGRDLGFATAFLGILDGGRLRYANAGHPPPLLRRAGGSVEDLPPCGIPLGVDPAASWPGGEAALGPGDLLLAVTDGLVEARRDGELFGERRVRDLVVAEGGRLGPQELADRAHRDAVAWSGRVRDDIVVLAVRRR